jgi:glutamyl-tRNA reductase
VPRNIDPAAGELENVSLYNIDDLQAVAREGVQARERELTACHQIIETHVATLVQKLDEENDRPSVEYLKDQFLRKAFAGPLNLLLTAT